MRQVRRTAGRHRDAQLRERPGQRRGHHVHRAVLRRVGHALGDLGDHRRQLRLGDRHSQQHDRRVHRNREVGGVATGAEFSLTNNNRLVSIAVTPASPSIAKGLTEQFTATGTYSDGSTADLTSQVTWASATAAVATITSAGLATGAGIGSSQISATLGGTTSPSDTLTVTAAALTSIAVAPLSPSVVAGSIVFFTATGYYTDGSTANLTTQVTWASGNASVAFIFNDGTGVCLGLAPGTTAITAALSGITSPSDTLTVTAATTGTVVVSSASTAVSGETVTFSATVSNASVSGSGPPTGSVQFLADGADVGARDTRSGRCDARAQFAGTGLTHDRGGLYKQLP